MLVKLAMFAFALSPFAHVNDGELAELKKTVQRDANPELRMEALMSIAALQPASGPPIEAVTRALSIGLDDDSSVVRTGTVKLLGHAQHPEVAVVELCNSLKAERRRTKKASDELFGTKAAWRSWSTKARVELPQKLGQVATVAQD